MRVLVAGGAGFIGSHLCDALLAAGHEVVCIDNLITGARRNIAHLAGQPAFRFIEQDVASPLPDLEVGAVLHLASPASPVGYGRYPLETLRTNSVGTFNLLELAQRHGARFLLASTSEVYGDPLVHPQAETYWGNVNPVGPRSCYDEGKRFAEALTVNYVWKHSLDARVIRVFNTYGPRNDPADGRIIPNFITQALAGEPITVYGDGRQTRSYCFVSDLVAGILAVAFGEGLAGEVFNLGNPEEVAAVDIARLITRLVGTQSPITHTAPRQEEIARRRPDIGKAEQMLGWSPRVSLEAGLKATVAWFRRLDK